MYMYYNNYLTRQQISNMTDISLTASRGVKLTKTPAHTRGNSWANCLARNFAEHFPQVCGSLYTVAVKLISTKKYFAMQFNMNIKCCWFLWGFFRIPVPIIKLVASGVLCCVLYSWTANNSRAHWRNVHVLRVNASLPLICEPYIGCKLFQPTRQATCHKDHKNLNIINIHPWRM